MLNEAGREAQLIAAVPRPAASANAGAAYPAGSDLLGFLIRRGELAGALGKILRTRNGQVIDSPNSIASEFVQLCYPWVRTTASLDLPGGLQGPEGVLAGVLARNALARGTFRSAAGLPAVSVYDTDPPLGRSQIRRADDELPSGTIAGLDLSDRVTLISPTPDGYGLDSDVTTTTDEPLRPAGVRRLISAVVRTARRVGEDLVFENSGENTWGRLAGRLAELLADLYAAGALRGATAADAFEVRCDRGTMTQNDIDNGRLVALIQLNPAASVEQLTVVLAAQDGGPLTATAMKGAA